MDSKNTQQLELEQISKRLQDALTARTQLEHRYEQDVSQLSRFIAQLITAGQGLDGQLDGPLMKLRQQLQSKPDLDLLAPQLKQLTHNLQAFGLKLKQQLRDCYDISNEVTEYLRTKFSQQPQQRQQLRQLLDALDSPNLTLLHYVPILLSLLKLLQQLPVAKHKTAEAHAEDAGTTQTSMAADDIRQIRDELLNQLSMIEFPQASAADVNQLRHALLQTEQRDPLRPQCLAIIRIIDKNIPQERLSAQQFLLSLNDTLALVHAGLAEVDQSSQQHHQAQQQLSEQIQNDVQGMSNSVESATQLQDLKRDIQQHVSIIAQALQKKASLEQQQQQDMQRQLAQMQTRLQELEHETDSYKKRLAEQKFKSLQDSLTRLPNRTAFEERLELEYKRWQRAKTPLALAVADIDHFKRINDNYGHIAGDKTLQVIANMLKKSLRETDFVCRYGGEEFVIIFPQTAIAEVTAVLNSTRERIKQIPFKFRQQDIRISISIGAAGFTRPQDDIAQVFERADKALYRAKRQGRDQVVIDAS